MSGRSLWQLGTGTVSKLGLMSLQNCAFCIIDHPIEPFKWAFDALMLGAGVGFRILKTDIAKLPKVYHRTINRRDAPDAGFIVPDSREGWTTLLEKVLESHFSPRGKSFDYSLHCLRSRGAPIKNFGGKASGPEELQRRIADIQVILNEVALHENQTMRPIHALDIMNIIGRTVVSGNVRRSAQIAIGDATDLEYLEAKRWDLKPLPNYRCYSNNSVIVSDIHELPDCFWEAYHENKGEPYGLFNLNKNSNTPLSSFDKSVSSFT